MLMNCSCSGVAQRERADAEIAFCNEDQADQEDYKDQTRNNRLEVEVRHQEASHRVDAINAQTAGEELKIAALHNTIRQNEAAHD